MLPAVRAFALDEEAGGAAPAPLPPDALLRYAALLAGLGAGAEAAAAQAASLLDVPRDAGRTCIDAGSQLMFSLLAPGRRALRLLVRRGSVVEGVMTWQRIYYRSGAKVERWQTEAYLGEPAAAWQHAVEAAERAGGLERLRQTHAVLGPRGHIYSVSWSIDGEAERASVSWQLDRGVDVEEALRACGAPAAWARASQVWLALFGHALSPRNGPWSILRSLHREAPRWRLGTTAWARSVEEPAKRRRLAGMVERLGGDARFAEGLYKLVESARRSGRYRPVGRAVEIEMQGDELVAAEFFLCMPPARGVG